MVLRARAFRGSLSSAFSQFSCTNVCTSGSARSKEPRYLKELPRRAPRDYGSRHIGAETTPPATEPIGETWRKSLQESQSVEIYSKSAGMWIAGSNARHCWCR